MKQQVANLAQHVEAKRLPLVPTDSSAALLQTQVASLAEELQQRNTEAAELRAQTEALDQRLVAAEQLRDAAEVLLRWPPSPAVACAVRCAARRHSRNGSAPLPPPAPRDRPPGTRDRPPPHPRGGGDGHPMTLDRGGGGVEEQGTWASRAQKHSEAGYGQPVDRGVWTTKTVKRAPQQPAQPPIRQLLGAADTQTAHPATFSTAPAHQRLGSANAETTPAGAPAAAADRTQRPNATCEGKNG